MDSLTLSTSQSSSEVRENSGPAIINEAIGSGPFDKANPQVALLMNITEQTSEPSAAVRDAFFQSLPLGEGEQSVRALDEWQMNGITPNGLASGGCLMLLIGAFGNDQVRKAASRQRRLTDAQVRAWVFANAE